MNPLIFKPILKRICWGGRRLGELLGKDIGQESDYAESWELADHGVDQSVVTQGPHAGVTLSKLMEHTGVAILGRHAGLTQFPLLIKFLDANDWLSLQVHPNDEQATHHDASENGKTEAWVILDAGADSQICAGLKPGVNREQLSRYLRNGTLEECLHIFPVKPGDCIFVPAGTVHAIGPEILLAEIQQQSDLTFRLHDWGRVDTDGRPRQVHVEESLACIDFDRGPVIPVTPAILSGGEHIHEELVRDKHFVIHRHITGRPFEVAADNQFHILMVMNGEIRMENSSEIHWLSPGSTILIPAVAETVTVTPSHRSIVLDIFLP